MAKYQFNGEINEPNFEKPTLGIVLDTANQERIEFMTIVEIFVYGFITILLIFTLLNILNMMSASIEKRKK